MGSVRVLVYGGEGYIGSRLVERLKPHADVGVEDRHQWHAGRFDVIYHLAGNVGPCTMEECISDNYLTTQHIASIYPDTRIIFASSCAVYADRPSLYGFMKLASEKILPETATILRIFNAGGHPTSLVEAAAAATEHKPLMVFGNDTRDYVHVDDVVEGLARAYDVPPGTYDIGTGKGTTTQQVLMEFKKQGVEVPYVQCPGRKWDIPVSIATPPDWFRPKYGLREVVANALGRNHTSL